MIRILLAFPIFLITLIFGIYCGYDASARHPAVRLLDGVRESLRNSSMSGDGTLRREVTIYGDWGGHDGRSVVSLTPSEITDVAKGQSYVYRVIRRVDNHRENRLLIEIEGIGHGSNLRKFVSLRFSDDGWMSVQGYGRIEDVDIATPTARYDLSRTYPFGNCDL